MKPIASNKWLISLALFCGLQLPAIAGPIGQQGQTKEMVCEKPFSPGGSTSGLGFLYEVVKDKDGKIIEKTLVGTCKGDPFALVVPSRNLPNGAGSIEWTPIVGLRPMDRKLAERIQKGGQAPASAPAPVDKAEMQRRLRAAEIQLVGK